MNELTKKNEQDKFIRYPTNNLFAIINDVSKAQQALTALTTAGFAERVQVFHGEEDAQQIDATGKSHGFLTQLIRLRQSSTLAVDHAKKYEAALGEGHCVIAVLINGSEEREKVQQILKAHGGHFINFYGRFAIHGVAP